MINWHKGREIVFNWHKGKLLLFCIVDVQYKRLRYQKIK